MQRTTKVLIRLLRICASVVRIGQKQVFSWRGSSKPETLCWQGKYIGHCVMVHPIVLLNQRYRQGGYFVIINRSFCLFLHKNICGEAILMSTHNICFYGDLTKIIPELSSDTFLICSTVKLYQVCCTRKNLTLRGDSENCGWPIILLTCEHTPGLLSSPRSGNPCSDQLVNLLAKSIKSIWK